MKTVKAYKLARPDGWDFYTGKTINYRESIGKIVKCPNGNAKLGVCSSGVIHASENPNDCFVGAKIPCSAYRVKGKPVCGDDSKWGFLELRVIGELTDLDSLFGWKYSEAINPIHPFKLKPCKVTQQDIANLKRWASVGDPVWDSVRASVWDSVGASVWDPVGAYIGSLFPNIERWKYIEHKEREYPFQCAVDLWKRGFVPSFDGKVWRLHSGKDAKIVYEYGGKE